MNTTVDEPISKPGGSFDPVALARATMRFLPMGPLRVALERIANIEPDVRNVDEFGMDASYVDDVAPLMNFFFEHYFRVETTGLENIPANGPVILVANHAGALPWDAVMLIYALRSKIEGARSLRPLLEDLLFYFPYLGTLMNRLGAVRACNENAERLLRQEASILVFPEGAKGTKKLYRDRYKIQRFGRGGVIRLAMSTGAPIIPVALVGSEETHPMIGKLSLLAQPLGLPYIPITPTFPWLGPLGLIPLPVRWRIRVGTPIVFSQNQGGKAMDRMTMKRVNEDLRASVQAMVDEELQGREGFFS